eukprot:4980669-Prymnesium_polylepis.1
MQAGDSRQLMLDDAAMLSEAQAPIAVLRHEYRHGGVRSAHACSPIVDPTDIRSDHAATRTNRRRRRTCYGLCDFKYGVRSTIRRSYAL